ncbi:hypothetical protein BASA81_001936 [Batrachochytrium salamandrivorans]|nr:hypothetical protein BASA81_001936 [Batrachochytrium salamandrivorans]
MFLWLLRLWLAVAGWIEFRIKLALERKGFECESVALVWFGLAFHTLNAKELDLDLSLVRFTLTWTRGFVLEMEGVRHALVLAEPAPSARKINFKPCTQPSRFARTKAWFGERVVIWIAKRSRCQIGRVEVDFGQQVKMGFTLLEGEGSRSVSDGNLEFAWELNNVVVRVGAKVVLAPVSVSAVVRVTSQHVQVKFACSKVSVQLDLRELQVVLEQLSPRQANADRSASSLWKASLATIRQRIHRAKRTSRRPVLDVLIANRLASKSFEEFLQHARLGLGEKRVERLRAPPGLEVAAAGRMWRWESEAVDLHCVLAGASCGLCVGAHEANSEANGVMRAKVDLVVVLLPNQASIRLGELELNQSPRQVDVGLAWVAMHCEEEVLCRVDRLRFKSSFETGHTSVELGEGCVGEEWELFSLVYSGVCDLQAKLASIAPTDKLEINLKPDKTVSIVEAYEPSTSLILETLHMLGDPLFVIQGVCASKTGSKAALQVERWGNVRGEDGKPAVDLALSLSKEQPRLQVSCTGAHFAFNLPMLIKLAELLPPPPSDAPPPSSPKTSFLPALPDHQVSIRLEKCTFSLGKHLALQTSVELASQNGDENVEISLQVVLCKLTIMSGESEEDGVVVCFPESKACIKEAPNKSLVHMESSGPINVKIASFVRPVAYLLLLSKQLFPHPPPPPPPLQFAYDTKFFPDLRVDLQGILVQFADGQGEALWRGMNLQLTSTSSKTFSSSLCVRRMAVRYGLESVVSLPVALAATAEGEEDLLSVAIELNNENLLSADCMLLPAGGQVVASSKMLQDALELHRLLAEAVSADSLSPSPPPSPPATEAPPPLFTCDTKFLLTLKLPVFVRVLELEFGFQSTLVQGYTSQGASNLDVSTTLYGQTARFPVLRPLTLTVKRRGGEDVDGGGIVEAKLEHAVQIELDVLFFEQVKRITELLAVTTTSTPTPPVNAAVTTASAPLPVHYKVDLSAGVSLSFLKRIPGEDYVSMLALTLFDTKALYSSEEFELNVGLGVTAPGSDQLVDPFHFRVTGTMLPRQVFHPQTSIELELLEDFTVNVSAQALGVLTWLQVVVAEGREQLSDDVMAAVFQSNGTGRAFLVTNYSSDTLVGHVLERDLVSFPHNNSSSSSNGEQLEEHDSALYFKGWFRHYRKTTATWEKMYLRVNPLVAVLFDSDKSRVPVEIIHLLHAGVGMDGDVDEIATAVMVTLTAAAAMATTSVTAVAAGGGSSKKRIQRAVRSFQLISGDNTRYRFLAPSTQAKLDLLLFLKYCQQSVTASLANQFAKHNIPVREQMYIGKRPVYATLSDGVVSLFANELGEMSNYCDLYACLAVVRPNAKCIQLEFPHTSLELRFEDAAVLRRWESSLAETMAMLQQIQRAFIGQGKLPCFASQFAVQFQLAPGEIYKVFGHSQVLLLGVVGGKEDRFYPQCAVTRDNQVSAGNHATLATWVEFGDIIGVKSSLCVRNGSIDSLSLDVSLHPFVATGEEEECLGYVVTNQESDAAELSWTVGTAELADSSVTRHPFGPGEAKCFFLQRTARAKDLELVGGGKSGVSVQWIASQALLGPGGGSQHVEEWKRGESVPIGSRFQQHSGHVLLLQVDQDVLMLLPGTDSGREVETMSQQHHYCLLRDEHEYVVVNAAVVENSLPIDVKFNGLPVSSDGGRRCLPANAHVLDPSRLAFALQLDDGGDNDDSYAIPIEFLAPPANTVVEQSVVWGVASSGLVQVCLGQQPSNSADLEENDDDAAAVTANAPRRFRYPISIRLACAATINNLSGLDLLVRAHYPTNTTTRMGPFSLKSNAFPVTFASHVDNVQLSLVPGEDGLASSYSPPFPLLVGSNGVVEITASNGQVFKFAIAIEQGHQVTIHAFYTLANHCGFDIEFAQLGRQWGRGGGNRELLPAQASARPYHPILNSTTGGNDDEDGMWLCAKRLGSGSFSLPFRLDVVVDTLLDCGNRHTNSVAATSRNSCLVIPDESYGASNEDEGDNVFAVSVSFVQHPRLEITFVDKVRVATTAVNRFLVVNQTSQHVLALVEEADLGQGRALPLIVHPGDAVQDYVFAHPAKVWMGCLLATKERFRIDMSLNAGWSSNQIAVRIRIEEKPLGRALVLIEEEGAGD